MKKIVLVLALLAMCATQVAAANLLTNGGFETGNLNGWTSWNVVGYGAGYSAVTPRLNGDLFVPGGAHSGSYYASAQVGYASFMGGLYQTIAVANGEYTVSGWLSGGSTIGGFWEAKAWDGGFPGGEANGGVVFASNNPTWGYGEQKINVTTGSLTVGFRVSQWWQGLTGGHIDDVSVTSNAVPEPSSLLALFSGLAGIAGIAFRKR